MGTISTAKVAGMSLLLGPIITVICYFIQQLVIFGDAEFGNAASFAAAAADQEAAMVITSIILAVSLIAILYGFLFIGDQIRSGGNGHALATYSMPLILIGTAGFVASIGAAVAAATYPEPAAAATAVFLVSNGMNGMFGIIFSLGFAAIFFAMASRDEYNSMFASIAGWEAVLAAVLSIVAVINTDLTETMVQIVGLTYIIHTSYSIYIGRDLLTRE